MLCCRTAFQVVLCRLRQPLPRCCCHEQHLHPLGPAGCGSFRAFFGRSCGSGPFSCFCSCSWRQKRLAGGFGVCCRLCSSATAASASGTCTDDAVCAAAAQPHHGSGPAKPAPACQRRGATGSVHACTQSPFGQGGAGKQKRPEGLKNRQLNENRSK